MTMTRFSISNRQTTKGRRYHGQHVNEQAKTGRELLCRNRVVGLAIDLR